MRTLIVTLLLCSCACVTALAGCGDTSSFFNADQEIRGVSIDWGNQLDRGPADALLDLAARHLGGEEALEGAQVKFVDNPKVYCITPYKKIAGCWRQDWDLVLLKPYPRLADTALIHELTHRAQFFATGKLDMDHKEAPWWPVPVLTDD